MKPLLRAVSLLPFSFVLGCPNKPPPGLAPNCVSEDLCFQEVTATAVSDDPLSTEVGDVDGDSDLDVVSVNIDTISVLKNNGGVLQSPQTVGVGVRISGAALGDVDNDGDLDLVTAAVNGVNITQILLFRNDGTGVFSPAGGSATSDRGASFIALGDLDGDGFLDVIAPAFGRDLEIFLNNGQGQFGTANQIGADIGNAAVAADLDGDGDIDIAVSDFADDQVLVLRNQGNAQFDAPQAFPVGGGPRIITAADLNNDGLPELITPDTADASIGVLRNQGGGSFSAVQPIALPEPIFSVEAADLNGDGLIDLATSNFTSDSATVVLNEGLNQFGAPVVFEVPGNPFTVAAGDLNADGLQELIFACFLNDTVTVLPASAEP